MLFVNTYFSKKHLIKKIIYIIEKKKNFIHKKLFILLKDMCIF